jgi:hypothetical protein
MEISVKDFADYVIETEMASKSTNAGRVKLLSVVHPKEETMRYVVVVGKHTSNQIKKLSYAVDMFNNAEFHMDADGQISKINGMIMSANRFA